MRPMIIKVVSNPKIVTNTPPMVAEIASPIPVYPFNAFHNELSSPFGKLCINKPYHPATPIAADSAKKNSTIKS